MKHFTRYQVHFVRRERRAIVYVLLIVAAAHLTGKIYNPGESEYDYSGMDSLAMMLNTNGSKAMNRQLSLRIDRMFDPDTVNSETLIEWGLPEDISLRWVKYRRSLNGFKTPLQIKSIYGMDSLYYHNILPFLQFKREEASDSVDIQIQAAKVRNMNLKSNKADKIPKKTGQPIQIDINKATKDGWQELHGIGPFYAERITRFRDKLGGFYSINQVIETYYLPDSVFFNILPFLTMKTPHQRIEINEADYYQLAGHPYISSKQANSILNYRRQHGRFDDVADIRNIISLDTAFVKKVMPYLFIQRDTVNSSNE